MTPEDFVNFVPIPLLYIRPDKTIGALNGAGRKMFGAEIIGRHYVMALRQPALIERIEAAMQSGKAGQVRYLGREAGRDIAYRASISPIPAPDTDAPAGLFIAFEDVTPFEEARKARSDFVANVSHELRTPLTALAGFIETLQGPARDDAEARERFLAIMAREAGRMNRLVQDLLSLARVEDQGRQRPLEQVDLCGLIDEQVTALTPAAQRRNVTIRTRGCKRPVSLPGDADQLRQVFSNLLENAIKYGAEGGEVQIRLSRKAHIARLRGPGLHIAVHDQGEGIAAHHIGRLTERFYRADTHRSRDMGGTGLGLAIVKHILNRHRGHLRITSRPGKGSCFCVMLPLE